MDNHQFWNSLKVYLSQDRIAKFESVLQSRTQHFTVVVENIFQSHNASAVIRNCDCFGIQDLHIIANSNSYILSKNVAVGSHKWVDMHHYYENQNNTQECINQLRRDGFQIVATSPHATDIILSNFDVKKKTAFFFGTELEGLSDTVLNQADSFLRIPMYGFSESYNVSVSAALVLYDVITRLKKTDINWHLSEKKILDKKIDWAVKSIKCGPQLLKKHRGF